MSSTPSIPLFATSLARQTNTADAARAAAQQLFDKLSGQAPDLVLAFASVHHQDGFQTLAATLQEMLQPACLLGCTGESLVFDQEELEETCALVVWAGRLPGTDVTPVRIYFEPNADGGAFVGWPEKLSEPAPPNSTLILLADPFSFPADMLLERLNEEQPTLPAVGGMASGGWGPGQNRLLLGGEEVPGGAVGVLLSGGSTRRTVVSQGCRPIGKPLVVTKADQNVIHELGGRPALVQLEEIYRELPPEDQALAQQGLHVGQVINEYQDQFQRGDFLIRNLQGADRNSGAIAIGDRVRVGQTVQFHVRDAQTADEDLLALVSQAKHDAAQRFAGGLLFTCNGRGRRLFGQPHHDAQGIAAAANPMPLAGFFAQGEIGAIGRKNFLHGFTASMLLFEGVG